MAELAVALELGFVEALVGGALMRKSRVAGGIVENAGRRVARQRGLEVRRLASGRVRVMMLPTAACHRLRPGAASGRSALASCPASIAMM